MTGNRDEPGRAGGVDRRTFAMAAAAAVVAVAVAACAAPPRAAPPRAVAPSPAPPTAASRPSTSLLHAAWADVGTPTPFRVSTAGPGGPVLLTLLYDTLTWKDERGVIPWLAESWEAAPDGRSYTFALARGVRWHDGQPLTADDVAFSFDYYARYPYRWTSMAVVAGADVLAPDRVRVRLQQPFAPFLEVIAGVVPIIPKHIWSRVGNPVTYARSDASVGSGPFTLAEYRSADGAYRLEAYPDYFRGKPVVGEYQQLSVPSETMVQAVRQGQLDLAWTTDGSVVDLFKTDPRIRVLATPPLSVVRLAVNTGRPPLDRAEVRRALAHALDREQIARVITKSAPIVGGAGLVPPETPWFDPSVRAYPFDLAKARALLGGQTPTIELLADPSNREPELMRPMLQAAGITLVTKRADGKTRTQLLREGSFQLGLVQHIGVGGDPDSLRRLFSGEEANDFAQGSTFQDARYEQLGREEAATLDPAKRKGLVFAMQGIVADQAPTIVLYYRRFYWIYDSTKYAPMNTWGGLLDGAPLVQNKLTFLRR